VGHFVSFSSASLHHYRGSVARAGAQESPRCDDFVHDGHGLNEFVVADHPESEYETADVRRRLNGTGLEPWMATPRSASRVMISGGASRPLERLRRRRLVGFVHADRDHGPGCGRQDGDGPDGLADPEGVG